MIARSVAVGVLAAAGCYSPSYTSCDITCTMSGMCPSGFDCVGGVCVTPGGSCGTPQDDSRTPDMPEPRDAPPTGSWTNPTMASIMPPAPAMDDPSLRDDMLEMFINVNGSEVWRTTRSSSSSMWITPSPVGELQGMGMLGAPDISSDGLQLVVTQSSGANGFDIHITNRNNLNGQFQPLRGLQSLNSPSLEGSPSLSKDRLTIVYRSDRVGIGDMFIAQRPNQDPFTVFDAPVPLPGAANNGNAIDESPYLSADKLTIYWASSRNGNYDLYYATRADTNSAFSLAQPITELNTSSDESDPWVSSDGRTIYFSRVVGGASSIWYATR